MAKRNGLGKGLDALFQDNNTEDGSITTLKIGEIEPNKNQPRTVFSEEALGELADSIRNHGILQPLVVRPLEEGGYQIVAGERRWRAARRAGLSEIPAVIKDLTEEQTLEIAIIENLQREDLNIVELARGYQALMDQYNMTQEQVAARMGKSRSSVANTVRLLALPDPVLNDLADGRLSAGHAKALLALDDQLEIQKLAQLAVQKNMAVRELEKVVKDWKDRLNDAAARGIISPIPGEKPAKLWGNTFYAELELALQQELGRYVKIQTEGKKTLTLEFYSDADLSGLAALLTPDLEEKVFGDRLQARTDNKEEGM